MSDRDRKEKYERVRSDFDALSSEEKVVFLLEASVTTVARGIDALGRAISDEINDAFNKRSRRKRRDEDAAPGETSESNDGHATAADAGPPSDDDSTETP